MKMEARKVNLALISCRFERVSGAGLWTEFNPRRWCIPSDDGSMENVSLTPLTLYFLGLNDFCSLTGYSFKNRDHLLLKWILTLISKIIFNFYLLTMKLQTCQIFILYFLKRNSACSICILKFPTFAHSSSL